MPTSPKPKSPKPLLIAIFALLVLSLSMAIIATQSPMENPSQPNSLDSSAADKPPHINPLVFEQTGEAINVIIPVTGPFEGEFDLTLNIFAEGYVKDILIQVEEKIFLRFPQQKFAFAVPFEDLAQAYYARLLDYIPVLEKNFGIDESLAVTATLTQPSSSSALSQTKSLLLFFFSCHQDSCTIVQSDKKKSE